MADNPVPGAFPLDNFAGRVSAVQWQDAAFWLLHAAWRAAEDAMELCPCLEGPEFESLLAKADEARCAMFSHPVNTATALSTKLDVLAEYEAQGSPIAGEDLGGGAYTVLDVIRRDCERLAKCEPLGAQAMPD